MTDADPLLRYRFTLRQRQVFRLVADGLKTDAIARRLGLSPRTVEVYVSQVAARIGYGHLTPRSAIRQLDWETRRGTTDSAVP